MEQSAGGAAAAPLLHKVLMAVCLIGTLALVAAGVSFASYYFANQDKIFIADISYTFNPGKQAPPRPLENVSFEEATRLGPHFEWGGCRAEKHDFLHNTFRLHCWGLARDLQRLKKDIEDLETPAPRAGAPAAQGLSVTSWKRRELSGADKFLTLLGAFAYHKLHVDIVAPPRK